MTDYPPATAKTYEEGFSSGIARERRRIIAILRGSAEDWGEWDVSPENRLVAKTMAHMADSLEKGDL